MISVSKFYSYLLFITITKENKKSNKYRVSTELAKIIPICYRGRYSRVIHYCHPVPFYPLLSTSGRRELYSITKANNFLPNVLRQAAASTEYMNTEDCPIRTNQEQHLSQLLPSMPDTSDGLFHFGKQAELWSAL